MELSDCVSRPGDWTGTDDSPSYPCGVDKCPRCDDEYIDKVKESFSKMLGVPADEIDLVIKKKGKTLKVNVEI